MHYTRWRTHGDPNTSLQITDDVERFWSKVRKTESCWIWTGETTQHGYGFFWINRKRPMAYRVAYEWLVAPIPEKMQIDHLCRNPACVNPSHLRVVTCKQNNEHKGVAKNNTSGVRGVSWSSRRNKWIASVGHNWRTYHAGQFDTLAEAEAAVIAKRNELFTHNDLDRVKV